MTDIADVAIVGYGPVGQALAIALAQLGHRIVVVERWPSLYNLPRAVVYDHETARILQMLGVADAMTPHVAVCKTYEWRNGNGQALKVFHGLDKIEISGWPDKVGFCQPSLEKVLDARVRSFGRQVELLQGWEVIATDEGPDETVLTIRPTENVSAPLKSVRARYVVGCDGANSVIRRLMGSSYQDLGFSADFLVVDIVPKDPSAWTDEQVQICDPARPTSLISGGPGRRRAELMLLPGESREAMNTPEVAWRLLEKHGWTPENGTLERHTVYTFKGAIATQWRIGRMMLAGDAAHLTPPFAGQGLCAGLRDVAALSWRLHSVLGGDANASLLDTYGVERAEHARRFTDFAIMLGGIICILDPEAAAGRDAYMLGPGANDEARFPDSRLTSSGLVHAGDPQGGKLALQANVRGAGRTGRFDDLIGNGFILLGLDEDPSLQLDPEEKRFMQLLEIKSCQIGEGNVEDIDGAYRRWFEAMGCRTVLIRPDFYIYGSGDASSMIRALRQSGYWNQSSTTETTISISQAIEEGVRV